MALAGKPVDDPIAVMWDQVRHLFGWPGDVADLEPAGSA
jgi:hypothetical protein